MKKPDGKAVSTRLSRYEILCEGAQIASIADTNANLGIPPWRPDGWAGPIAGEISIMVQGNQYVLCSPLRSREPVPVSSDFVFALGSVLGFFEPFDGGRGVDGTRIVYTRAALLKEAFGPDWERYAHAMVRCDARLGSPLVVDGLPRK